MNYHQQVIAANEKRRVALAAIDANTCLTFDQRSVLIDQALNTEKQEMNAAFADEIERIKEESRAQRDLLVSETVALLKKKEDKLNADIEAVNVAASRKIADVSRKMVDAFDRYVNDADRENANSCLWYRKDGVRDPPITFDLPESDVRLCIEQEDRFTSVCYAMRGDSICDMPSCVRVCGNVTCTMHDSAIGKIQSDKPVEENETKLFYFRERQCFHLDRVGTYIVLLDGRELFHIVPKYVHQLVPC